MKTKTGVLEIDSLGHVIPARVTLPISARRRCLHAVAGLLAGGIATEKALAGCGKIVLSQQFLGRFESCGSFRASEA
jgi:hypothetical protein